MRAPVLDLVRSLVHPEVHIGLGAAVVVVLVPLAWWTVGRSGGAPWRRACGSAAVLALAAAAELTLARYGGVRGGAISSLSRCHVTDPWTLDAEGALNLGLLVPFAGFVALATGRVRLAGALAVAASASFEYLQAFLDTGVCDSSDLLRNAAGALGAAALVGAWTRAGGGGLGRRWRPAGRPWGPLDRPADERWWEDRRRGPRPARRGRPQIREGLDLALTHLGHRVMTRADGESAAAAVRDHGPDVVLLDVMLPGIDGFEVCRRVRTWSATPIIMLTARSDDMDVVAGLEAGADDYVAKPVQPRVLDARIKAVLRRAKPEPTIAPDRFGSLVIDRASLVVTRDRAQLDLTPTELRLLLELSAAAGRVLSREQLLRSVWEQDHLGDSRLVDACVQRLRAKIEEVPASPRLLQTVRGFGYRFTRP